MSADLLDEALKLMTAAGAWPTEDMDAVKQTLATLLLAREVRSLREALTGPAAMDERAWVRFASAALIGSDVTQAAGEGIEASRLRLASGVAHFADLMLVELRQRRAGFGKSEE